MEYFMKGIRGYVDFTGRDRRRDYWMFVLVYSLIYIILSVIDELLGTVMLAFIFNLFMLLPSISYATRRLHDTGRSGWWQLLYFIPLLGLIVVIVFLAQDSDKETNAYGSSPKYASA